MVEVRLTYLIYDPDRYGTDRYYVRRPGQKKIRLRQPFGTPAFRQEYDDAMDGKITPKSRGKIVEGSAEWLCRQYYSSNTFMNDLAPSTQTVRKRILDKWATALGDRPFAKIQERNVLEWFDARAHKPHAADNFIKALRGVFRYAKKRKLIVADPTTGIELNKKESDGFHTWTEAEVEQFEAAHPVGTKARLALALLLYTGVRRSDLVTLGPQLRDGFHRVKQEKTEDILMLPILPELQEVIDATPCGKVTYLVNEYGQSFTANGFGARMRKWCDAAGLPHCTGHGLRKVGATRAAERGASDRQMMAIFGWSDPEQASIYIKAAEQKKMASAAMGTLAKREIVPPEKVGLNISKKPRKNNVG